MTVEFHDVSEYVIIYFTKYSDAYKQAGYASIQYRHYKKQEKFKYTEMVNMSVICRGKILQML